MVAGLVSSLLMLMSSALSMSSCCCRPCGHRCRVDVALSSSAVGPACLGGIMRWYVVFAWWGDASSEGELACGKGRKPWARVWQSSGGQTEWREPP
ncbi:hypothetical protein EDB83DRAFT_2330135 [Lactarius deliciosus]|nr:hypothetical protein EDB83DRAFT_2330135 [Lactarius deliciosus]